MANFNGYNQPESNGRSNNLDDTIGMEQTNSQNVAETNPYLSPENNDKKPSLAKKIIIGGAAVALAVAVGVGVYSNSNKNEASSSEEQTVETPASTDSDKNKQEPTTDTVDVDNNNNSAATTPENSTDIKNDGVWIINYNNEVTIPNLDSYQDYYGFTIDKLDRRCQRKVNENLATCLKSDPISAGCVLGDAMDSHGYDGVESFAAHDGYTTAIYPAVVTDSNNSDLAVYVIVKDTKNYKIIITDDDKSAQRQFYYLCFKSDFVPSEENAAKIWQDNQDLLQPAASDERFDDNALTTSGKAIDTTSNGTNSSSSSDLGYELEEYGADNNPSAYDDGPQA